MSLFIVSKLSAVVCLAVWFLFWPVGRLFHFRVSLHAMGSTGKL